MLSLATHAPTPTPTDPKRSHPQGFITPRQNPSRAKQRRVAPARATVARMLGGSQSGCRWQSHGSIFTAVNPKSVRETQQNHQDRKPTDEQQSAAHTASFVSAKEERKGSRSQWSGTPNSTNTGSARKWSRRAHTFREPQSERLDEPDPNEGGLPFEVGTITTRKVCADLFLL